ncbi:carbohydrate ABC transporter permease [Pseudactinotalea suaedae]|uniref:carbohydrate ABC transporter permease n=1 Tax=Pseudactinotalea suaedae TaxID=1524924 RepID=UPI0012E195A7|nr:carbohydrate ABC transporter permease [Pseudactinotalea suaedae]
MRTTNRSTGRPRPPVRVATIVQYAALVALAVASFALIALMVVLSLRPGLAIYVDFWRLPIPPYLGNFTTALGSLLPAMGRTLLISAVSIALLLIISTVASYSFARLQFPGRDVIFYGILAVMTVPAVITLSPNFILADQLNLLGSLWGLIVFYVAGGLPFAIFLITTFFRTQPVEIFEAARVDGASELRIMLRLAVPLAMPILVTVAILNFLTFYGDYIWPSLVLTEANQTLLLALQQFNPSVGQFGNRPDYGVQTAGYVVATIPQLLVFAFGMKYFVAGVTSGAIKA